MKRFNKLDSFTRSKTSQHVEHKNPTAEDLFAPKGRSEWMQKVVGSVVLLTFVIVFWILPKEKIFVSIEFKEATLTALTILFAAVVFLRFKKIQDIIDGFRKTDVQVEDKTFVKSNTTYSNMYKAYGRKCQNETVHHCERQNVAQNSESFSDMLINCGDKLDRMGLYRHADMLDDIRKKLNNRNIEREENVNEKIV